MHGLEDVEYEWALEFLTAEVRAHNSLLVDHVIQA